MIMTSAGASAGISKPDSNVPISFEDQQTIIEYTRLDARAKEYGDEFSSIMIKIENLRNYYEELSFIDEDDYPNLPYLANKTFTYYNLETIQNHLKRIKKIADKDLLDITIKMKNAVFKSHDLKSKLYHKYGKIFTLEAINFNY